MKHVLLVFLILFGLNSFAIELPTEEETTTVTSSNDDVTTTAAVEEDPFFDVMSYYSSPDDVKKSALQYDENSETDENATTNSLDDLEKVSSDTAIKDERYSSPEQAMNSCVKAKGVNSLKEICNYLSSPEAGTCVESRYSPTTQLPDLSENASSEGAGSK